MEREDEVHAHLRTTPHHGARIETDGAGQIGHFPGHQFPHLPTHHSCNRVEGVSPHGLDQVDVIHLLRHRTYHLHFFQGLAERVLGAGSQLHATGRLLESEYGRHVDRETQGGAVLSADLIRHQPEVAVRRYE